ncbi:MAG: phasin family protein [Marinicaulis sp.]|nr:phasin family protein [Marinicaulis sp.]NNE41118.1 phasin family protein [Marinicaulis sp.]NNL88008.1 phasin family protein [Marinicaulis sp.]
MATAKKTTTKKATEANPFEAMTTFDNAMFKEGYEKFAENVTAVADFQKDIFEAFVTSASAYAKGVEKITGENTTFVKEAFEDAVSIAKTASTSKNVQEAFEVNKDFAKTQMEKNVDQVNKVSELWMETATKTAEPLNERYSELVEKIQAYRV